MLNRQNMQSLLSPWLSTNSESLAKIDVKHLVLDSRKVVNGDTFVAVNGHLVDGRKYITSALKNGANAVIAQASDAFPHGTIKTELDRPIVYVQDIETRLSELATRLYSSSSELIGVTGTNGKTTITQLIAQWLNLLGKKASVMGTTGNGFLSALQPVENTTGSAIDICRTLAHLSDLGSEYTALEVSSHGLIQGRVKSLPFSVGIFSNLSRDHLDYHGTMEEYALAKQLLFTEHDCKRAVINADDKVGAQWLSQLPEAVAVSLKGRVAQKKALWATEVEYTEQGIRLSFDGTWGAGVLTVPLIGAFNASNILLSLAALFVLGFDKRELLACSTQLRPVIGRMELFQTNEKAKIVVDYAHTPDALEKAISALRIHCAGKLWVIFGCGGDRDKGKRPLMAEIAQRLADNVIITDDNPRSENPEVIVEDILQGLSHPERARVEHDRFRAIEWSALNASEQDIILVAGKGHEDYQVLKNETIHYSDRESAAKVLGLHL